MAMQIAILDAFTADQGDVALWSGLRDLGETHVHPRTGSGDIATRLAGCAVALTNKVPLSAEMLAGLPDLRYVGVMATGFNIVDLTACKSRGIAVTNVPGYSTESVAQLVLALTLHFTCDVAGHSRRVLAGAWATSPDFCFFTRPLHELAGKTALIIGGGAIGSAVARLFTAFGMHIVFGRVPGSTTPGRVALDEALPRADVVTLHCPLTPATKHLVDRTFLSRCKSSAILINTGRGPLVDDAALAESLAAGRLAGAGLDVLTQEPPPADHPLLRPDPAWADRLAITPHIAWGTIEARLRLIREVGANLKAWIANERRNRVDG